MTPSLAKYLAVVLATFLATRLIALIGAHLALAPHQDLLQALSQTWDPAWYQEIAARGYDGPWNLRPELTVTCPDSGAVGCLYGGEARHSNLAFFPLFPLAIKALSSLGVDPLVASLIIATVAACAGAVFIALIVSDFADHRTGIITTALWAAMPMNIVLSAGRPEPVFVALAAGTLLLMSRDRVLAAAVLTALAGLTRFQAIALIVPLVLFVWLRPHRYGVRLAVTVIAPAGLLAYLAFVGGRTGSLTGWFDIQREWLAINDWGASKLQFIQQHAMQGPAAYQLTAWTLVGASVLLVACVAVRLPWQLTMYSTILVVGVLVQTFAHTQALRYILAAFPLVIPIALLVRRLPTWLLVPALVVLAVASAATQAWFWPTSVSF